LAGSQKTFVRDATGLVRNVGFLDQFLMSQSIVNPVVGFVLVTLFAPVVFPGAYLPLVFLLGSIPAFAMAIIYSVFTAAMPRSGADYVWSTRILGPAFGAVQAVFLVATTILLAAFGATISSLTIVLAQVEFELGVTTNNPGLISLSSALGSPTLGFPVSMLIMLACGLIVLVGMGLWRWIQRVSFVLYYVAAVVFTVLLVSINSAAVPALFDNAMKIAGSTTTYAGILSTATSSGFSLTGLNWNNTLLAAIPWGFLTFTGFNYSAYLGGEVKNARSSVMKALLLSATISTAILVVFSLLAYRDFGQAFLSAASYVESTSAASLPTLPTVSFLMALSYPSIVIPLGIAFFLIIMLNIMGDILAMSRILFAASFDRLLPTRLADVNDRFHTPHWSIAFITVVWSIWVAVLWYAGYLSGYLNTGLTIPIGYGLPFVATLLFYFVKKDLYKRTVGTVSRLYVVIPASLVALGSFVFYIISLLVPISAGTFLGANLPFAVEFTVALLVLGLLIYGIAVVRARRSGIDLRSVYSEIPPE
jgi:basic amino acid/polyamine antiporter, APA family